MREKSRGGNYNPSVRLTPATFPFRDGKKLYERDFIRQNLRNDKS